MTLKYCKHSQDHQSEPTDTLHSHGVAALLGRIDSGDAQVCCLIRAILSETVLLPELQERLGTMGIDLDALRHCLEQYHAEHPTGPRAG